MLVEVVAVLLMEVVAVWMDLAKGIIYFSSQFLRIAFSRVRPPLYCMGSYSLGTRLMVVVQPSVGSPD